MYTNKTTNHLITAAMPLLLLIIKLKATKTHKNPNELRQQIINEIHQFEIKANNAGHPTRIVLAARYCICTALDETVLCTAWGNQSDWAQHTLLSSIQKETWGGERFFIILNKMTEAPKENLAILELLYLLLSLGYEGKYYNETKNMLDGIRQQLFQTITTQRELSNEITSSKPSNIPLPAKSKIIPTWKIVTLTTSLLFAMFCIFNFATANQAKTTLQQLTNISPTHFTLNEPIKKTKTNNKKHKRYTGEYYF